MPALAIALAFVALTMFLYIKLRFKRFGEHRGIPQLAPSLLWGNLKTIKDFAQRGTRNRHPGSSATEASPAILKFATYLTVVRSHFQ